MKNQFKTPSLRVCREGVNVLLRSLLQSFIPFAAQKAGTGWMPLYLMPAAESASWAE